MSELRTKRGGSDLTVPAGASTARAEFEKLLQLGNGQFECDNRQEALTCYLAAFELTCQVHDFSTPLISAVMASFSGVATPCSRPKRAMPPFR